MTISFSKRLAKLEEAVASRTQGPKTIRRVVVEVGADLPTEGPDEPLVPCGTNFQLDEKSGVWTPIFGEASLLKKET